MSKQQGGNGVSAGSAVVRWYRANAWLPVALATVVWVGAAFLNTGGSAGILSLAGLIALGFALMLLAAVKIADYIGSESNAESRQRGRNVAIALSLVFFVGLFYAATIVRMGNAIAKRPLAVTGISFVGAIR